MTPDQNDDATLHLTAPGRPAFAIGDRVRARQNKGSTETGTICAVHTNGTYELKADADGSRLFGFPVSDLERIDDPEVDRDVATAKPCGCEAGRCEGEDAGQPRCSFADEAPAPSTPLAPEAPEIQLATLRARVKTLERLARLQADVNTANAGLTELIAEPALDFVRTTTRRMRVNVKQLASGKYQADTTFELTSDDPGCDFGAEMEAGLGLADMAAREEIARRTYTDEHGAPGSDDQPF